MDRAHKFSSASPLRYQHVPIGQVFTPLEWAEELIASDLYELWLDGASVFDPTGGQGHLLEAFVARAVKERRPVTAEMLERLCMTEIDPQCIRAFHSRMQARYGMTVPAASAIEADFLLQKADHDNGTVPHPPGRFDAIVGNPPWINFADIPDEPSGYRNALKPLFLRYGLLENARAALWGGSRIDLAALVLVKALVDHLKPPAGERTGDPPDAGRGTPGTRGDPGDAGRGTPGTRGDPGDAARAIRAGFFLPLSLFRNEGAHNTFRRLLEDDAFPLALERVRDITATKAFAGVRTRYAMVHFSTRAPEGTHGLSRPAGVLRRVAGSHAANEAANEAVTEAATDAAHEAAGTLGRVATRRLTVSATAKPRQGVNTCGANAVLMFGFDELPDVESDLLFPLIDRRCFAVDTAGHSSERKSGAAAEVDKLQETVSSGVAGGFRRAEVRTSTYASRYVLLPYDSLTGRVLDGETLEARYPKTWNYLSANRERLTSRRGSVIRSSISRGLWWALLGVGPYTFAPYKIVWPAYGVHTFTPRLFYGNWIPNQALQCSMSFSDVDSAGRVLEYLCSGAVERSLLEAGGAGTPGWAQPGRMRKFFEFREDM